jgi:hypothetical protein
MRSFCLLILVLAVSALACRPIARADDAARPTDLAALQALAESAAALPKPSDERTATLK